MPAVGRTELLEVRRASMEGVSASGSGLHCRRDGAIFPRVSLWKLLGGGLGKQERSAVL